MEKRSVGAGRRTGRVASELAGVVGAERFSFSAPRRVLLQLPLERLPVQPEPPRGLGDVAAGIGEHALDVLPLGAGERWRHGLLRELVGRKQPLAGEGGEQLVGVHRLLAVVGSRVFSAETTSRPLPPGMRRSTTAHSGESSPARRSASLGPAAVRTSCPRSRSARAIRSRKFSSSSTSRMESELTTLAPVGRRGRHACPGPAPRPGAGHRRAARRGSAPRRAPARARGPRRGC